jgi:hypothetical protein
MVDLGDQFAISDIIVTHRGDCCTDRLVGALVYLSNQSDHKTTGFIVGQITTIPNAPNPVSGLTFGPDGFTERVDTTAFGRLFGRYVTVAIEEPGKFIHLAEVQVYSVGVKSLDRNLRRDAIGFCDAAAKPASKGSSRGPPGVRQYTAGGVRMNWLDAQAHCRELGGDLARIDSRSEEALALAACQSMNIDRGQASASQIDENQCWIGANDLLEESQWQWSDAAAGNNAVTYSNWHNAIGSWYHVAISVSVLVQCSGIIASSEVGHTGSARLGNETSCKQQCERRSQEARSADNDDSRDCGGFMLIPHQNDPARSECIFVTQDTAEKAIRAPGFAWQDCDGTIAHEYPTCAPACMDSRQDGHQYQVPGRIYRVSEKCYRATSTSDLSGSVAEMDDEVTCPVSVAQHEYDFYPLYVKISNWKQWFSEPNDLHDEDCAEINRGWNDADEDCAEIKHGWNDAACSNEAYPVCMLEVDVSEEPEHVDCSTARNCGYCGHECKDSLPLYDTCSRAVVRDGVDCGRLETQLSVPCAAATECGLCDPRTGDAAYVGMFGLGNIVPFDGQGLLDYIPQGACKFSTNVSYLHSPFFELQAPESVYEKLHAELLSLNDIASEKLEHVPAPALNLPDGVIEFKELRTAVPQRAVLTRDIPTCVDDPYKSMAAYGYSCAQLLVLVHTYGYNCDTQVSELVSFASRLGLFTGQGGAIINLTRSSAGAMASLSDGCPLSCGKCEATTARKNADDAPSSHFAPDAAFIRLHFSVNDHPLRKYHRPNGITRFDLTGISNEALAAAGISSEFASQLGRLTTIDIVSKAFARLVTATQADSAPEAVPSLAADAPASMAPLLNQILGQVFVHSMPSVHVINLGSVVEELGAFVLPLVFTLQLPIMMHNFLSERETGTEALQLSIGTVSRVSLCASTLIADLVVYTFTLVVIVSTGRIVGLRIFSETTWILQFLLYFGWGCSMSSYAFFLSRLFSSARTASCPPRPPAGPADELPSSFASQNICLCRSAARM